MKYNIKNIIKKYKTPLFIYNKREIIKNIKIFRKKNIKIFYALKANYNEYIIKLLYKRNIKFEVISKGEIEKLIKIKVKYKDMLFSGIYKEQKDIDYSLKKNIGYISIDSFYELKKILANNIKKTILFFRINLNIKVDTKKNIKTCLEYNKFGMNLKELLKCIKKIRNKVHTIGLNTHLGSQIKQFNPYNNAIKKMVDIGKKIERKFNIKVNKINIGGGIGIDYINNKNYLEKILKYIEIKGINIYMEPGRSLVGNSCIILTKIGYIKNRKYKNIAIVNIGMDSIIRPMLYKSYHRIKTLLRYKNKKTIYEIVGPICESTDILYKKKSFHIKNGDILVIYDTGAYCLSMKSNYNIRRIPKEIIINKGIKAI